VGLSDGKSPRQVKVVTTRSPGRPLEEPSPPPLPSFEVQFSHGLVMDPTLRDLRLVTVVQFGWK